MKRSGNTVGFTSILKQCSESLTGGAVSHRSRVIFTAASRTRRNSSDGASCSIARAASNFSLFFHNVTGMRPGAWQQAANLA